VGLGVIYGWIKRNRLRLWFLGICLLGFVFLAAYVIFLKPFLCSPTGSEKWAGHSYEYSYPKYYGSEQRGQIIIEKEKPTYGSDSHPKNEQAQSAYEVICGETKITDLAIAFLTYCLVAVGWFAMRSSDENTKRGQRAYLVAGPLFGIPDEALFNSDASRWLMQNRAEKTMFHGPWHMVMYNFGETSAFSTRVVWGLCPIVAFPVGIRVSDLLTRKKYKKWRDTWTRPAFNVENIFSPKHLNHYRHVRVETREETLWCVFFGRVEYRDVFGDAHWSTFSYFISDEHADGIGVSLSKDHGDGECHWENPPQRGGKPA